MDDATKDKLTKLGMVAGVALLIVLIVVLYKMRLFGFFGYSEATILGAVVLVGLALVVLLMALLVMVYSGIGVANHDQPLGLPEGSVRALIAFSLVLIFVLLGAFLFTSVSTQGPPSNLSRITKTQLDELGKDYVVVFSEPIKDAQGQPVINDNKEPLYNANFYARHSKDGDDFAKQIFATLATIFTSVISFYFGSSAAASGAGALAKAMGGGDGGRKPTITKLDPDKLAADSSSRILKIIGDRLGTITKVKFGSVEAKPDNIADKLVIVTVPSNLLTKGPLKVSVVGDNGESSSLDLTIT
jgi:hypothetical protein